MIDLDLSPSSCDELLALLALPLSFCICLYSSSFKSSVWKVSSKCGDTTWCDNISFSGTCVKEMEWLLIEGGLKEDTKDEEEELNDDDEDNVSKLIAGSSLWGIFMVAVDTVSVVSIVMVVVVAAQIEFEEGLL